MLVELAQPYLCVFVVSVQHGGVTFPQSVKEFHQEGRLTPGQRVPDLLDQHWQKHTAHPRYRFQANFSFQGLGDFPTC